MGQYLPIIVLLVLAILFGALSFLASTLLAPKRPHAAKEAPYECGIVPGREPPQRFPVSFYIVAMLIMFDIEIIFVYPYAVDREFLGSFAFFEMLAFSAVFFVAFVYVVARGALDWGPLQRAGRIDSSHDGVVSANRTTTSTIRRVGAEGRIEEGREGVAA
ncbi:MAG: NADH-quinone oxidoreductase subunit A [Actinomycetota bacterium]